MNETPLSKNELIKAASPDLSGTIVETLADTGRGSFHEDDSQLLKFHGMYQQDDRDKRRVKREFSIMVRTRQTGGLVPPEQYLAYDALADSFGNGTLRITTRQTFQFHGVVKNNLKQVVRSINDALGTTIATAGDVNRNVMAPPAPPATEAQARVLADAFDVTRALIPTATAYHQIWLDGKPLAPGHPYAPENPPAGTTEDPLYGATYLPRKFKIAFAIPPNNDTDIFTNDLGFAAVIEDGVVAGYNLLAGGGLGAAYGNAETYPRLADTIGFLPREHVAAAARAALATHRDHGDRGNRRHARLKYLLAERGVAWFAAELEARLGFKLAPARLVKFTAQGDAFGWHDQLDGKKYLTLFVECGRIKDAPGPALKTALRELVAEFRPTVHLTPWQNIILGGIAPEEAPRIDACLQKHGVDALGRGVSRLRGMGLACPALPTCGFAITEAERVFPGVVSEMEKLLESAGLPGGPLTVRMTGCPNGCARPYASEIGFVGRGAGKYNIMLGGDSVGTRLNRLYRENVKLEDFTAVLSPLLERFCCEHVPGERMGDFFDRVLSEA